MLHNELIVYPDKNILQLKGPMKFTNSIMTEKIRIYLKSRSDEYLKL